MSLVRARWVFSQFVCHAQKNSATCWEIQACFWDWFFKGAVPMCREEQGLAEAGKLFLLLSISTCVYLGIKVKAVRGLLAVAGRLAREWHCPLSFLCPALSQLRISAALCV